jgi:hypothetical protein
MTIHKRMRGLLALVAVAAIVMGGGTLLWTPPANAARCCWVMVCSNTPPYACWEVCKTCPKFP